MNDLDWLARNVHEWPTSKDESIRLDYDGEICFRPSSVEFDYYPHDIESAKNAFVPDTDCVLGKEYTYDQWQTRRAELQGKPSWIDAPEWAEWLAQDSWGDWEWYESRPYHDDELWYQDKEEEVEVAECEILGDWRDTLERRPERKPSEKTAKALEEAKNYSYAASVPYDDLQNGSNIMIGVSPTLYMQQFGRAKRTKQWTGPEDGLPPVGSTVAIIFNESGEEWEFEVRNGLKSDSEVEILAHFSPQENGDMVAVFAYKTSKVGLVGRLVSQAVGSCFRPLRTGEEKEVEDMLKVACGVTLDYEAICRALVAEGYRKLDTPADND